MAIKINQGSQGLQRRLLSVLTSFVVIATFVACDGNVVYKKYQDIPDNVWARDFSPEFEFEIEDTEESYNLDLMIRNASFYPYNNIWVFIHQTDPNGLLDVDTLEIKLADEAGKWLGDGMGDLWDNKVPWKINYHFEKSGKYSYRVEHAMRTEKVPGILDLGLSVEKQELKK